ncbi:MAG: carbohydrate binding domain-containing protein [Paludibacter sp.]
MLNNVLWNNTYGVSTVANLNTSTTTASGTLISKNFTNGGQTVTENATTIKNNDFSLSGTNVSGTNQPIFKTPTTIIGSSLGSLSLSDSTTIKQSVWRILPGSYLVNKGIALPASPSGIAPTDKDGRTFGTTPAIGAYEGLTAPVITGITPTSTQLSVAFTAGSNGGYTITNYKYSTDGGTSFYSANTSTSPIIISTLSSDGTTALTTGTTYNIQIKAVNANGDGIATASNAATPIFTAPTSTAASAVTSTGFTANWTTASQGPSATYTYTLQYGTVADLSSGTSNISSISSSTLSQAVSCFAATTYYYRVMVTNGTVSSAWSAIQTLTTTGTRTLWSQDLSGLKLGDSQLTLTATSSAISNPAPITYVSSNTSVVSVSGSTLTVVGPGTATVTAQQAGNAYNEAAADVVQNVTVSIINAGFEDAASGYTVSESSLNVLRRVAGIADGTTQIASPTSSAISVTPGMWLKKAPSTNYISGVISNYDPHSGTNCLNLKIKKGTPITGNDTWTNAIAIQKLSLTNTQKYTVSFWAKRDSTSANVASVVTAFIRDNVTGTNLSCAIPLTGGTTWTQYSATFDIPTFKAANVTADFTTAFAGIGLTTTYDASTIKTNYSGVLLDDFSVTTTAASTVAVNTSAVGTGCVVTGGGVYTVGSSANVVASPNNGYKFVNWTEGGTEVTTTASYTFTVSAARTLVANFVSTNTTCTVSPTTLSGFSYTNGNGPSSEQSFTVSGTNLLSNIAISSSTNCQISTGTGASFVSTNPILLTNSGTLATTTIYIRLKAGLAAGTIASENTTISTLSLAVQNVASSGSVSSNPVLTFATPTPVSKTYGNAVFTNAASSTAGSAGAVTYASGNTAVATVDVNSGQVSIVGAGSSVITASIAANGIYGAANASYTLNVAQKSLTITATGPLKTYGTALTAGTSATNFTTNGAEVSGETISIVTLTPDAAGLSATTAAGVAYIVSPSLATGTGGFSASNYNITYTAYNGTVATTAPYAPTIGTATAGNGQAWVSFSAPSNNGGANITSYTVTSSPDGITGIGSTSPILVTGLSNKAYSFTVTATNSTGTSATSAATNSATPNTGIVNVTSSTSVGPLALTSGSDVVVGSGALLTIDATTSVNSLTIAPGGQVTNSSSLTASAMTINSDGTNSGTGTYIDNDGTTTAVTTTTVNQTLTSARNWYISSPISVAKAQTGYTFYSRDETNNAWTTMTTGNGTSTGDALNIGQGYIANLASGTATYSFSGGTLNTGTITTGLNGVPALTLTSTKAYAGYNLVGNPYPSYLDWVAVSAAATNVDASFWYRTKNGSVYEFDTYNASSGVGTNNATVITRYIPPMQAFWVKVSSGTSGTLALTNAMRSHNDVSSNKFRTKAVNNANQSVLYLQVSNGVNSDEAIVLFNSNASNGLDAYDSQKMSNANSAIPEIYTTVANESLVINGMNAIPYDTEIPLGFTTGQAGTNFCIKASQLSNFPSGTKLIFKDYQDSNNPIIADLSDGSSYIFSSGVSTNNTSRFALIFKAPSIITGINPADSGSFWFSTNANGQIMLNGTPNAETSVAVYNAIGQRVAAQNLSSTIKVFDTRLVPGVYTIVLKSVGKTAKTKVIIK